MNDLEIWFFKKMREELITMKWSHKTDSIDYIVGMLGHDLGIEGDVEYEPSL